MNTFENWKAQAERPGASIQVRDCVSAWEDDREQLFEKIEQLEKRIAEAEELIKAAVEIMTTEQVGQWRGVRTWQETEV